MKRQSINTCLLTLWIIFSCLIMGCSTPRTFEQPLDRQTLVDEQNTQYALAISRQQAEQFRLYDVAFPILNESYLSCGQRTKLSLGLVTHQLNHYPKEQRDAAQALFSFNDMEELEIKVLHAIKGSPTDGYLLKGDTIKAINHKIITKGNTRFSHHLQAHLNKDTPIVLEVIREGIEKEVHLKPVIICDYGVQLSQSDNVNGFADGTQIIITSGMMRFTENNDQLAFIVAHELVHNALGHIPKRFSNTALGTLIDIVISTSGIPSPFIAASISSHLYSQDFETEADLIGLELMHAAGYDVKHIDTFWQRMAATYPRSIPHASSNTHPSTAERVIRIREKVKQLISSSPSQ